MAAGLFIAGTDTAVGKTHFSALLVRALRAAGIDAVGMKPFCCGDRTDAEILCEASGPDADIALINPVWLRVPAAPYTASLVENRPLDVDTARSAFESLSKSHAFVVVEGVGGWRVPLTDSLCMSDFALSLELPVLVVSANRLGTLNHTQLTVDAIQARGAVCAGVVLNEAREPQPDAATVTNAGVLEHLLKVPLWGEVAFGTSVLPRPILEAMQSRGFLPQAPATA